MKHRFKHKSHRIYSFYGAQKNEIKDSNDKQKYRQRQAHRRFRFQRLRQFDADFVYIPQKHTEQSRDNSKSE